MSLSTLNKTLRFIYSVWIKLGLLLHKVMSPLVLGLIFFGVITPVALISRLFGRDILSIRIEKNCQSYWIERHPPGPEGISFKHQF